MLPRAEPRLATSSREHMDHALNKKLSRTPPNLAQRKTEASLAPNDRTVLASREKVSMSHRPPRGLPNVGNSQSSRTANSLGEG
ncbi:hypothetical protein WAI453_009665 [Rhynchosporium graminicola]